MSEQFNPSEMLQRGAEVLQPLLESHGFVFSAREEGRGSGGHFAIGQFSRSDHRVELHYRWGLGIVRYVVFGHSLSHEEFMRAQGAQKKASFPTVLDKSLLGFEALLTDLRSHGAPFLSSEASAFLELARWCRNNRKKRGFSAIGS